MIRAEPELAAKGVAGADSVGLPVVVGKAAGAGKAPVGSPQSGDDWSPFLGRAWIA